MSLYYQYAITRLRLDPARPVLSTNTIAMCSGHMRIVMLALKEPAEIVLGAASPTCVRSEGTSVFAGNSSCFASFSCICSNIGFSLDEAHVPWPADVDASTVGTTVTATTAASDVNASWRNPSISR